MAKTIFLHIGTHKTGSTAIQHCIHDNMDALISAGYVSYGQATGKTNHSDIYLATMRQNRDSFARIRSGKNYGYGFRERTRRRVQGFICETGNDKIIITTEGLSLLRFDDEFFALKDLLDADVNAVRVIVYVRERQGFLRSYRQQIEKLPGRTRSADRASVLYAEDDSWIADFDTMLALYRRHFPGAVTVLDYDREKAAGNGDIIPSFFRAIGAEGIATDRPYFLNVS